MKYQKSLDIIFVLTGLLLGSVALTSAVFAVSPLPFYPLVHFSVDEAGNISPQQADLDSGQTAVWTFATASPANALVRQRPVYPYPGATPSYYSPAPYEPTNVNEFMTPLPMGMSGIFVISETKSGYVEQTTPCVHPSEEKGTRFVGITQWFLCSIPDPTEAEYQRTMDSTWENPAVTGVFIRLKWSDLQTSPTTYDDTILLREVDKAVANGKLYSIGIKSGAEGDATPTWLFENPPEGAGLTPVTLDWKEDSASCANIHDYGNPTDDTYRELYLDMLSHVASVLKQNSARWRSLAYVKISGANSRSAENQLPNGCKAGCICNDEEWAKAGYTPRGLYTFYEEQMARIVEEFPGKSMSYSLIQDGFPRVVDPTDPATFVDAFEQTETIIINARSIYGDGVSIAHLGLGPKPDFSNPLIYYPGTDCPLPLAPDGVSLAHGSHGVGSGCPNRWVTEVSDVDGLTHFQTSHPPAGYQTTQAERLELLSSALENMWSNSGSVMLEVYEASAWEANDSILDPTLPPAQQRTLAQWNERLHNRRRNHPSFSVLGDPAPTTISFTFTGVINPYELFYYSVPKRSTQPAFNPWTGNIKLLY